MLSWNLLAAWVGIFCGMAVGAFQGLRFHRSDWQGGYPSWRRRLGRLGHISFFGLAFINLAFVLTESLRGTPLDVALPQAGAVSSVLLIVGALTMPLVCFLSAWREKFRHLFFIPVGSLLGGVGNLVLHSTVCV